MLVQLHRVTHTPQVFLEISLSYVMAIRPSCNVLLLLLLLLLLLSGNKPLPGQ